MAWVSDREFTSKEMAKALGIDIRAARYICVRFGKMGLISAIGTVNNNPSKIKPYIYKGVKNKLHGLYGCDFISKNNIPDKITRRSVVMIGGEIVGVMEPRL